MWMNGKVTFSPARKMCHQAAVHIKMSSCIAAFVIEQLPQFHTSAHATLMVLSAYLCHLCRCWKNCCSRYFGIDTGFCSLVELVRSESSPLLGLVWSSAETERDYINVQPLQYFLCNPAGCTPTPTFLCSVADCSEHWCYLLHTLKREPVSTQLLALNLIATVTGLTICSWWDLF